MIKILHVSDVHFGAPDPKGEQGRITDALITAVEAGDLDPDVIIFSGDLAHAGTAEQLKTGEDWLQRLCKVAPRADLVVLPGNHDVQRSKVRGPDWLHAAGSNTGSYEDWKRTLDNKPPVHLEEFFSWIERASRALPLKGAWSNPFGFHYTKEGLELPLHIIGLNSALLSCDDTDEGKLVVDVRAANEALHRCQKRPGLIVAAAHHPFVDLVDWNKGELERILSQETGADLYLHGHLHTQLGRYEADTKGKSLAKMAAGAAYQGSTWPQQFAAYTVDFTLREIRTVAYTYSAESGEWVHDNKLSYTMVLNLMPPPIPVVTGAAAIVPKQGDKIPVVTGTAGQSPPGIGVTGVVEQTAESSARVESDHSDVQLEYDILRYWTAARGVEERVGQYLRGNSVLSKNCYQIKNRLKKRERIKEKMRLKGIREAAKIVDICGFRLITYFQGEIPIVVEHILQSVEQGGSSSPFKKGCRVEIDINTSRTENDPLSISEAVQSTAAQSQLKPIVVVRSRATGYSSVHMIVSAPIEEDGINEMRLEIQIRSAWEDIWGEIDHRLRYGSERGGVGVLRNQHLNVFKVLIDGVVQYGDVIRRQSDENNPKPPNAIKAHRPIATPDSQLRLLQGLTRGGISDRLEKEILDRFDKAFDLWKQADASRQRGGNPGLLRQAADAFASILQEFKGQPANNVKYAEELEYVAATERAYLLMYTGDDYDLAQSAELYLEILAKRPKDATALFRLGIVKARQKQLDESDRLLSDALTVIESGKDARLDVHHWAYDIARLHLGLTRWRIFKAKGQLECLSSAIGLAKSVNEKLVDPENSLRAVNDLLYYACEERLLPAEERALLVSDAEFRQLMEKLEKELTLQDRSYEYQDTLMTALALADRHEDARAVALRLRDMLEQMAILKSPEAKLGKKGTYAWTAALGKVLNDQDQQECLAHALDVIASIDHTLTKSR